MAINNTYENQMTNDGDYSLRDLIGDDKNLFLAQKVVIGATGINEEHVATTLNLILSKEGTPTSDLLVEIREWDTTNDKPSDEILEQQTVAVGDVTTTGQIISLTLDNLTLDKDGTYGIILKCGMTTYTNEWQIGYGDPSDYSQGKLMKSIDNGETWTDDTALSYYFEFQGAPWGIVSITYNEILTFVPEGVSETVKTIPTIQTYAQKAQGKIDAFTRYDWTANWESISSAGQQIIKGTLINLVMIDLITYSYADFSTRFEAREVLEERRTQVNEDLERLRDQDVQTFIKTG